MKTKVTYKNLILEIGNYEALTPQVAFSMSRTPSVGQIALAFLQASFAFSGWNFLNYVTEEVVEPRRWVSSTTTASPAPPQLFVSVTDSWNNEIV